MKVELRPGLQGRAEAIVDTTNVAAVMGSGDLDVFATPALIAVEGRKLTFKVGACDDHGPIGNGTHERFIIDKAKFIAKLQSKR